jgi:hypothetical protein
MIISVIALLLIGHLRPYDMAVHRYVVSSVI